MRASSDSVGEGSTDDVETVRVRVWSAGEETENKDAGDVITVTPGEAVLWRDAVEDTSETISVAVHPDDAPATVEVYTSDSLGPATETFEEGCVDGAYWDGPLGYGATFTSNEEQQPVTVDVDGRVLFLVSKSSR